MSLIHNFKNARAVIKQIKNGEWDPEFNEYANDYLTANRGDDQLWLDNGSLFCDINHANCFGYIFRHYVYYAAARKLRNEALKAHRKQQKLKFY